MKSLAIVDCFNEVLYRSSHLGKGVIVVQVDLFVLQGAHESFGFGIVIRIANATHADLDLVLLQHAHIVVTGVLHTAIGMMRQLASTEATGLQSHLQSS